VGVSFSVILMAAQGGLFLGFAENSSLIIDHVDTDIWVTSKNSKNFDFSQPISERKANQVERVQGVARTEKLILTWGNTKTPEGGSENVEIVGYNPDTGIGGPWNMKEGLASDVKGGMYAIMDESADKHLGKLTVGDYREVFGQRLKIVGLSRDVKSFTTAPVVFTSYSTAQQIAAPFMGAEKTVFILVRVVPGVNPNDVVREIRRNVDHVDVYTKAEYSSKTMRYWMFETGMGVGFLLTMAMAFLVGIVIVGQTIYSSTMDHLKEFGTLKAIGAENRHIYEIIFHQAFVNAFLGFLVGMAVTYFTKDLYVRIGAALVLPPWALASLLMATFLMCFFAAFVSVWKAMRVEPAEVFR
jgi:putative ABC transport system permease protein